MVKIYFQYLYSAAFVKWQPTLRFGILKTQILRIQLRTQFSILRYLLNLHWAILTRIFHHFPFSPHKDTSRTLPYSNFTYLIRFSHDNDPTTQHCRAGIATGHGLDDRGVGVRVLVGARHFHLHIIENRLWSTQPVIQWTRWGLSPRGKMAAGREADHSPPTNSAVENTWISTYAPPYVFMAYFLIS
jgi:hypothetical protein